MMHGAFRDSRPSWIERGRRAGLTLLVLLACWAMFWTIVTIGEQASRPAGLGTYRAIELVGIDRSGQLARNGKPIVARHEDPYEYVARDRDWGVVAARYEGGFNRRESGDHVLFLTSRNDVIDVRLNGVLAIPDVRRPRLNGSFMAEPVLYTFAPPSLREGENRFSITVRRNLRGPFVFPDFAFGPAASISGAGQIRHFMSVEAGLIGIVVMGFTALLALSVAWPQGERRRNSYFVAMLSISAVVSTMFMFSGAEKYEVAWLILSSLLVAAQAVSLMLYAVFDLDHRRRISPRNVTFLLLGLAVASVTVAITNYRGINPNYHVFILMISCRLFSVGAALVAAGILAREIVRSKGERVVERVILAVWYVAIALDQGHPGLFAAYSPFAADLPLSLQWTPILGSLTGLAKVASLARQAGEARRAVVLANERLQATLALREEELAVSYQAREQMLARQAMLEERQRIVRDMHDGIGGQLVGLMMQVRSGSCQAEQVEVGLQSSIADLRLIVDSMDTAEECLAEAFHSFEHRVRPQVEASGMALLVNHDLPANTPALGPRRTLQVLRILQEGVTNAIRHSGGRNLTVTAAFDAAARLRIVLADDGRGLPGEARKGRGLTNMKTRADALAGTFDIASGPLGTTLTLVVPTPENSSVHLG